MTDESFGDPFKLEGDAWTTAANIGRSEAEKLAPAVLQGITTRIAGLGLTPDGAATARLTAIRHLSRRIAEAE